MNMTPHTDSLAARYRWSGILLVATFLLLSASVVFGFLASRRTGLVAVALGLSILSTIVTVRRRLARQLNESRENNA
jgi:hypothetical protein